MYTFLYIKKCDHFQEETAHLYEHAVIQAFYKDLQMKYGIHPGVAGYIGGETYRNLIFIEAWFYDQAPADSFTEFMQQGTIDDNSWPVCLHQCEAESREQWTIPNTHRLQKQLAELAALPWENINSVPPFTYNNQATKETPAITVVKCARRYKTVVVSPYLEAATIEEQTLFLRLYVIVQDIIFNRIRQRGWYSLDNHLPVERSEYIFAPLSVVYPRGAITTKQLEDELENEIHTFDVATNKKYIDAHFMAFERQSSWVGAVREKLHYTNVVASNRVIADLATEERIVAILQSLRVRVENVSYDFAKELRY